MTVKFWPIAVAAALLAASPAAANRYSNQLRAMPDATRAATLAALMRGSGERCAKVTRSLYQGASGGTAMWTLRCDGRKDWMISIDPDSSTNLLECSVARIVGSSCWQVFRR